MCLYVWIGTQTPVPPRRRADAGEPDPIEGSSYLAPEEEGALVRACFASPFVTYVGSNDGCGCAYNSGRLACQGVLDAEAALSLVGAMSDEERAEFEAGQRSRARLRELIESALSAGPVEVYGCWAGDEGVPPVRDEAVSAKHFTSVLEPIEEGVRYLVGTAPESPV